MVFFLSLHNNFLKQCLALGAAQKTKIFALNKDVVII
jgi:hypothetical protein